MVRNHDALSTIKKAPVHQFVYSSLSFFGARRGGALPGSWFVRALTDIGRDPAAIRQTLYRMEQDGELTTRKLGRVKLYAATRFATATIDAGTQKIFERRPEPWDGEWTVVCLRLEGPAFRVVRERARNLLGVE